LGKFSISIHVEAIIVEYGWGRIGTRGQARVVFIDRDGEGMRFVCQFLHRRAGAEQRIGVAYREVWWRKACRTCKKFMRGEGFRTCSMSGVHPYSKCLSGILSQNFDGPVGDNRAFFMCQGMALMMGGASPLRAG
jgi:hypothetical protein